MSDVINMIGRALTALSGAVAIVGGMWQHGDFSNVCIVLAGVFTIGCFMMVEAP